MKLRTRLISGAGFCLLAASAFLFAQSKGALEAGRARELLQHLGGGDLPKAQVRIKQISAGVSGNDAIVEAQLETAYRFERTADGWKLAEIRLGDQHWESAELVAEAVRREKNRRTALVMQQLADALEEYRGAHSGYVVTEDIVKLLDQLPPRYAGLRFDLWRTPFSYRGTTANYQLSSAGADRQPGTADDLTMKNGKLQAALPPELSLLQAELTEPRRTQK